MGIRFIVSNLTQLVKFNKFIKLCRESFKIRRKGIFGRSEFRWNWDSPISLSHCHWSTNSPTHSLSLCLSFTPVSLSHEPTNTLTHSHSHPFALSHTHTPTITRHDAVSTDYFFIGLFLCFCFFLHNQFSETSISCKKAFWGHPGDPLFQSWW